MVKGNIFPALVTRFGDLLAYHYAQFFYEITATKVWPLIWKEEYVTVIPKKTLPESVNDLRNISCTALPSKVYESYILNWAQREVKCKKNQFGGVKGCSTTHFLIQVWDEIGIGLEDARAASLLMSIDYVKAFNRLSYQECLAAFHCKGASAQVMGLISTFLTNRTMAVRVG